jgi:hypothetical protein
MKELVSFLRIETIFVSDNPRRRKLRFGVPKARDCPVV